MRMVGRGLPCIRVIGEAALAADLITGLTLKHLERNLAVESSTAMVFHLHARTIHLCQHRGQAHLLMQMQET